VQVLRRALQDTSVLREEVERHHLASGSTVQGLIVRDMLTGCAPEDGKQQLSSAAEQLLMRAKAAHTQVRAPACLLRAKIRLVDQEAAFVRSYHPATPDFSSPTPPRLPPSTLATLKEHLARLEAIREQGLSLAREAAVRRLGAAQASQKRTRSRLDAMRAEEQRILDELHARQRAAVLAVQADASRGSRSRRVRQCAALHDAIRGSTDSPRH